MKRRVTKTMDPPEVGTMLLGRDRLLVVSGCDAWSGGGNGDVQLDEYTADGRFRFACCTLRQLACRTLRALPGRAYTHGQIKSMAMIIRMTGRLQEDL